MEFAENQLLYPFAKFQYYDEKKFEKDARSYTVRDYELGWNGSLIKHLNLRQHGLSLTELLKIALKKQQATRKSIEITSSVL
jgi:hypothetical protein